jgi:hypothetical protein
MPAEIDVSFQAYCACGYCPLRLWSTQMVLDPPADLTDPHERESNQPGFGRQRTNVGCKTAQPGCTARVTVGIRRSYPQPIPLPRPAGALRSEFITVEEISGTARFATEFVLEDFKMLLLIIILLLLFGGGGGYYGHSRWGARGGLGVVGTVVVIALLLYFLGVLR